MAFLTMFFTNFWVIKLTQGCTYDKITQIPSRKCALVLGTSPKMISGKNNPYFLERMKSVAELYRKKKVKKIIVSGEKSLYYDEPKAMKNYLVYYERIPASSITEDKMGFSTQISVMRCKYIYLEENIIIVSQKFHNLRALFFARNEKMNALAFEAKDIDEKESFYRNHFREFLARTQAVFLYILKVPFGFSAEKRKENSVQKN